LEGTHLKNPEASSGKRPCKRQGGEDKDVGPHKDPKEGNQSKEGLNYEGLVITAKK